MRRKIHFLMREKVACGSFGKCKTTENIEEVECSKCIIVNNNYHLLSANRYLSSKELATKLGKSIGQIKDLRKNLNLGRLYTIESIPGEKWKKLLEYPELNIEISNFGRFKNKSTNRLYNLSTRKSRLFLWTRYKGKHLGTDAAKLVYKYFVNDSIKKSPYFNDGNFLNIRFDNLTTKKPFHKNYLNFLEKTKIKVKNWIFNYKETDFQSAKHFASIINLPYHKMCSFVYAMKRYLGLELNEKIKFYKLCNAFINAVNSKTIEQP